MNGRCGELEKVVDHRIAVSAALGKDDAELCRRWTKIMRDDISATSVLFIAEPLETGLTQEYAIIGRSIHTVYPDAGEYYGVGEDKEPFQAEVAAIIGRSEPQLQFLCAGLRLAVTVLLRRNEGEGEKGMDSSVKTGDSRWNAAVYAWRDEIFHQARLLDTLSLCQIPKIPKEKAPALFGSANRDEPLSDNERRALARVLLGICFYSLAPDAPGVPAPRSVRALAERIVRENDGEGQADWTDKDRADWTVKVERLLRQGAFEEGSVHSTLKDMVNYKEWERHRLSKGANPGSGFEQEVFMIGSTGVGKSSFLFALEEHAKQHKEKGEVELESRKRGLGREVDWQDLEPAREGWRQGGYLPTGERAGKTARIRLREGQVGGFRIADTMGEFVSKEKELKDYLDRRLRPATILVTLPMEPPTEIEGREKYEQKDEDETIADALKRALKRILGKPDSENEGEPPVVGEPPMVYVVLNRFDAYLARLGDKGAAKEELEKLSDEMGRGAFELGPYFWPRSGDASKWEIAGGSVRRRMCEHRTLGRHDDDARISWGVSTRRAVVEDTFDKWPKVFGVLWEQRIEHLRLCFVCSAASGQEKLNFPAKSAEEKELPKRPGMDAFWNDLDSMHLQFEGSWCREAVRVFGDGGELDRMIEGLIEFRNRGAKLQFRVGKPDVDSGRLTEDGKRLAKYAFARGIEVAKRLEDDWGMLSRLCRRARCHTLIKVLEWGEACAAEAKEFDGRWQKALKDAIDELNLPHVECGGIEADKLKPGKGNREEEKTRRWVIEQRNFQWDRGFPRPVPAEGKGNAQPESISEPTEEMLREFGERSLRDFYEFEGWFRGPAMANDLFEWEKWSPESYEWLRGRQHDPLWQAVKRDIDCHSDGDKGGLSNAARTALRLVADYRHPQEASPGRYSCFALLRWWDSDSLLSRSVAQEGEELWKRTPLVLGLLEELGEIRYEFRRDIGLNGEAIRKRVTGYVAGRLLEGMGFDLERAKDIDRSITHELGEEGIEKREKDIRPGLAYFRKRRRALDLIAEKFERLTFASKWICGRGGFSAARRRLRFLGRLVSAAQDESGRAPAPSSRFETFKTLERQVSKRCKNYSRKIDDDYFPDVVGLILNIHRRWIECAVDLDKAESQRLNAAVDKLGPSSTGQRNQHYSDVTTHTRAALKVFHEIVSRREVR